MARESVKNEPEKETKSAQAEDDMKMPSLPVYTVDEFTQVANALFGCNSECVLVALKEKGIKETTEERARKVVSDFMKREVKK